MTRIALACIAFALIASPTAAQMRSEAQDLSNCAGAVAATGNLDVVNYPRGASGEWSELLGRILERLNREDGVQGMTGRYAASAARSYWLEQPASEREAAATACRVRYGS